MSTPLAPWPRTPPWSMTTRHSSAITSWRTSQSTRSGWCGDGRPGANVGGSSVEGATTGRSSLEADRSTSSVPADGGGQLEEKSLPAMSSRNLLPGGNAKAVASRSNATATGSLGVRARAAS